MKINSLSIVFFIVASLNLLLGIFVFIKGKRKLSNKIYSIFALQLAIWSFIGFLTSSTLDEKKGEFLIRLIFAYSSFIPSTFYLFAVSLGEKTFPKQEIRKILLFFGLSLINTLISFSPNFIVECHISTNQNISSGPIAKYGKVEMAFFTVNILFILGYGLYYLYKKKKEKTGIISLEIHYVFLAILFGTIYNVLLGLFPILFTNITITDRLGPFASVIVSSIIIYGIAKYKIMDVIFVYETVSLYSILTLFLFIIYFFSYYVIGKLFYFFRFSPKNWQVFLSGFIVAMAFSPLKEKIRGWLRVKLLKYDVEIFTQKFFEVLFSLLNPKELLENLTELLSNFLNIPKAIMFLFKEKKDFPFEKEDLPMNINLIFEKNSPFFEILKKTKIIIKEEEKRVELIYPEKKAIVEEFERLGYDVAVKIEEKGDIKGIIFLKRKLNGTIFSYRDQLLLQNLGYQIGFAIENIKLYHKVSEVNSYIKSLVDNSPFGVVSLDKNGKISLVSKQMEIFLGKDERELAGKDFREVLPSEIIPLIEKKYENFDKEIITDEIIYQNLIFNVNIVPFYDEKGREIGIMIIFSDITKIKQLQHEIKEKEKMASLGVMAAGVAHEIKNPLVAIKTFVDLFPERYTDPEFREVYSRLLQDEVKRINHLVEQILLFANPNPSKIEQINIVEMLKSIIMLWKFQNKDKNIKVVENFSVGSAIIKGDREKLKEVFLNVLVNSHEAVDNEKGVIGISLKKNGDIVEICVSDNGIGIKKEIMDKIFDPFFTTKEKGTGLGLSIVRKIVEEHGGNIKVESEETKGTRVYIQLPLIKEDI